MVASNRVILLKSIIAKKKKLFTISALDYTAQSSQTDYRKPPILCCCNIFSSGRKNNLQLIKKNHLDANLNAST